MRWMTFGLLGLLLSACSGSFDGAKPDDSKSERPVEVEVVVEVEKVGLGAVADVLVSSAIVEAEAQADLFPEASGVVVEVRREEGDVVRKGEVLAVFDNVMLDAGAERAQADLARVRRDYERLEALFAQGAVSERELLEAKYQYDAARTSAREASRTQGQTRITAPFDGVVAARDIRVGELASSAKRAFQVVDLTRLRVVASLPERDLARVRHAQRARLVSAYDPDVWATGTVTRIAPVVDPTSGTFRVILEVDPEQQRLRPGQYVSVLLQVDQRTDVVVIPRKALLYEDGLPIAYAMVLAPEEEAAPDTAKPDEPSRGGWAIFGAAKDEREKREAPTGPRYIAERRHLEVGLIDAEQVEVSAGLTTGDQVVVVGQSNLKQGTRILTAAMKVERDADRAARAKARAEDGDAGSDG